MNTSGNTRQPTSASQTSARNIAKVANASIASTPIAIGSGAITNQIDSTSALAFDSNIPVECLWCHSSGSFRYCRVTRRRYVACSRYCITPAPIRRPTTPIARRIAMPMNNETSPAIAANVVSPRSRAGRTTLSVAQPSANPSATVIAPYNMLASTDRAKTHGSSQIATLRTARPLRVTLPLSGTFGGTGNTLQDSQVHQPGTGMTTTDILPLPAPLPLLFIPSLTWSEGREGIKSTEWLEITIEL